MRKQTHVVKLSGAEQAQLEEITRKGKCSARCQVRARILLHADSGKRGSGWTDGRIAEAVGCCEHLCWRVRKQYVEQGLDAVLTRKQRMTPPVAPIFDGEKEAKLIALACSSAPVGHARWTLRLLEEKVVELKIVEAASDNTIGRVLKKTNSNLTARSSGLSRRSRIARS
jgi:Homeodomain-like domain